MIEGEYAGQLVDEMLRFLSERTGWPSTLLRQSTLGLMKELTVAGAQVANGVLSSGSFADLVGQTKKQMISDPGLGPIRTRGPLLSQVPISSAEFVPASFKYKAWIYDLPQRQRDYVAMWRTAFQGSEYDDTSAPSFGTAVAPFTAAGFLVSHLLYLGISATYLSRWLNYRAKHDPSQYSLDRILGEIEDLLEGGYGPIEIMVTCSRQPQQDVRTSSGWLDAPAARQWLSEQGLQGPESLHGAILYRSEQWDLDGALVNVARAVHRLSNRSMLKTGKAPEFHRAAWIAGVKDPRRLPEISQLGRSRTPGYELGDQQVIAPTSDDRLEVAVELLVASLSEPGPSSVGTLWAALEALLAAPGDPDRIQVSNRAGDIALIALVRSSIQISLGTLFSRCAAEPLACRLSALDRKERLIQFEAALLSREYDLLPHRGTRLALDHTRRLFDADNLQTLRNDLRQTLRALYRQRNLVLHGGVTDAPLREGILRSSIPLVAAVINRYAVATQGGTLDPHVFAYEMYIRTESVLNDPVTIVSFW